jgi:hypothetical protein
MRSPAVAVLIEQVKCESLIGKRVVEGVIASRHREVVGHPNQERQGEDAEGRQQWPDPIHQSSSSQRGNSSGFSSS